MAMSVVYTTINGVLYHENRGGVETEYIPDTLGSLIGCRDSSGNVMYTADYWSYGEVRTSTGSKTSPWGFAGLLGCHTETMTVLIENYSRIETKRASRQSRLI